MTTAIANPAATPVEPPVAAVDQVAPAAEPAPAPPAERPRRKLSLHYGATTGERP